VVQRVRAVAAGMETVQDLTTQDDRVSPATWLRSRLGTGDPAWLFTAPEDGVYRVMVRDQFGTARGGIEYFYRLRLRAPKPDFQLMALADIQMMNTAAQAGQGPRSGILRPGGAMEIYVLAS